MDDFQLTLTVTIFINGNFLINYVATRGPDLEPFVVGSLIQLLCPVTKFGWLDDDRFKEVIKEARNFLSQVMIFFSLFDFCLFVCFFGLVLFCFVCLFFFFFFFSFPPYFLMIASRKYIQLSSSVSYLFSCCVRLLV